MAANNGQPQLTLKCITLQLLHEWFPETARQNINVAQAWRIISREFCGAVVTRGVCPIDCLRCKDQIVDLFRLEKAEKPAALLTWLAKDHAARWIEKRIAAEKISEQFPAMETPQQAYDRLFPIKNENNPFLEMLKDYE